MWCIAENICLRPFALPASFKPCIAFIWLLVATRPNVAKAKQAKVHWPFIWRKRDNYFQKQILSFFCQNRCLTIVKSLSGLKRKRGERNGEKGQEVKSSGIITLVIKAITFTYNCKYDTVYKKFKKMINFFSFKRHMSVV